jgi:hypothetical protein
MAWGIEGVGNYGAPDVSSSAFPVSSATVALAFSFLALVVLNKTTRNLLRSRKSTLPEDDILF